MSYAVISSSGSQYLVSVGDKIELPNLGQDEGKEISFDSVLLVRDDSGSQIGSPTVNSLKVTGRVVKNFSGEKIDVFKFKAKSRYRRKMGFRADLSLVEITQIGQPKVVTVTKPKVARKAKS